MEIGPKLWHNIDAILITVIVFFACGLGFIQEYRAEWTPLRINLDRMGKWIGSGALTLCFVLAGLSIMQGHEILEMFV